eukprot:CAMPEP_0174367110 /NCGR_PEP_ID=MMETSP0811_2-20130205/83911_1 /TAXON_ID=73025 ORGANISM="Eutreptiella gymnastica-like, Strain CCMP1594" /NCGR_SAMPLE_ID=MMETSP0811_2 /ASSEMBLY_ACC=CAM_ASM_000667 /LENGTH=64 /DNA_ID=CAMNT_0015509327 /DNA_START=204 /DNA_END=395 /DNA_ORIENTATION=+
MRSAPGRPICDPLALCSGAPHQMWRAPPPNLTVWESPNVEARQRWQGSGRPGGAVGCDGEQRDG